MLDVRRSARRHRPLRPARLLRARARPGSAAKASASRSGHPLQPGEVARAAVDRRPGEHLVEHRLGCAAMRDRRCFDCEKGPAMASALAAGRALKPICERREQSAVELLLERHDHRRQIGRLGPFPGAESGSGVAILTSASLAKEARQEPGLALAAPIALPDLADQILGEVVGQFLLRLGEQLDQVAARCRSPPPARAARLRAAPRPCRARPAASARPRGCYRAAGRPRPCPRR